MSAKNSFVVTCGFLICLVCSFLSGPVHNDIAFQPPLSNHPGKNCLTLNVFDCHFYPECH